jgi:hypothetical protein
MARMIRPKAEVLPESALVPDRNLIRPPPDRFTHEVVAEQPYYYRAPGRRAAPAGRFAAGTRVLVLSHDGGAFCHVVDGQGLRVVTAHKGLRPIE